MNTEDTILLLTLAFWACLGLIVFAWWLRGLWVTRFFILLAMASMVAKAFVRFSAGMNSSVSFGISCAVALLFGAFLLYCSRVLRTA